ncbi:alcohol dehydrogenase catalytic domain-containing protein [Lentibacillus sp.]|uniref:alcohol dehydrogenase catalytic domain-containing protein n=1 Tax=Lentibacillus sp. TaxID=1925746 RepID=UPI002B4AE9A4|nr:alcohol dehydrogenase catalytic domain-containing protein [Lentibacillus sp.]HLS07715.1 alcohol dehydrogenase catalytic domain-containing protein [Lentibacillus sp.]
MNKENIVESRAYQLTEPWQFKETTLKHHVNEGEVVVKTSMVSICHADLRYYTGQRRKEALERKLPMALFHEGIGKVVTSKNDSVYSGQRVVIVPNIPGRLIEPDSENPEGRDVADNYSENSVFLGSGFDGIGQEYLVLPGENVTPIPDEIPDDIAVLAELNSVSYQALRNVGEELDDGKVAVFGDGPLGYLTAAMLSHVYKIERSNLIVFGAIDEKLAHFDFATTFNVKKSDFSSFRGVTTVVECTGGKFSESAINQAIELIEPQGRLVLMGVSEERVPINTRDVLEKGLKIYGTSRSTSDDFKQLMLLFRDADYQNTLSKLLPDQHDSIENVDGLKDAMDRTTEHKGWKKAILEFKW